MGDHTEKKTWRMIGLKIIRRDNVQRFLMSTGHQESLDRFESLGWTSGIIGWIWRIIREDLENHWLQDHKGTSRIIGIGWTKSIGLESLGKICRMIGLKIIRTGHRDSLDRLESLGKTWHGESLV